MPIAVQVTQERLRADASVCKRAGCRRMEITDPALLFDTQAVMQIRNPDALMSFVDEHGADLAEQVGDEA